MASPNIKAKIVHHLSENGPSSWAETVAHICKELGVGPRFVEEAMRELVDKEEVLRLSQGSMPSYAAPGAVEGKYKNFYEKRLEQETKSGTFEDDPWHRDIKGPTAV